MAGKITLAQFCRMAGKPSHHDREITDAGGLSIRIRASGATSFQLRYRRNGRTRRLTLGRWPAMSLPVARRMASKALSTIAEGHDPAQLKRAEREKERAALTFGDVADQYIALMKQGKRRSARAVEQILKSNCGGAFGRKLVEEIEQSDIFAAVKRVRDRGSHVMANRLFTHIRAVLNFAMSLGAIDRNPALNIRRDHITVEEKPRGRVLSDDEIKALWTFADPKPTDLRFALSLRLLILTGARCGELLKARVDEFDLNAGTWSIPEGHTKTQEARVVYLSRPAIEIIKAFAADARDLRSTWLMPTCAKNSDGTDRALSYVGLRWGAMQVLEAIGAADARLHDMRRTCRTLLGRLRIPVSTAEMYLGHSLGALVEVYDVSTHEEELREAAQKLADHIDALAADVISLDERRRRA